MIGITVKTKSETKKVIKKAKDANIKSLSHAGGALRKIAMRSFQKKAGASPPGSPPHTHTKRLPKAILYAVDKRRQLVIVGPAVHLAGQVGKAHEFGGYYMGSYYPRRPFMRPALEKIRDKLPRFWLASVR